MAGNRTGWGINFTLLLLLLQLPLKNRSFAAESGWFFNPSVFYHSSETEFQPDWTGSGSTGSWTKINAAAGMSLAGGLLLGVKYFSEEKSTSPQGSSGDSVTETVTAAGVTVGFNMEQLVLQVSVMGLQPPKYTNNISDISLSDGSGTILDLMYLADLGGWYLGPQVTWRSFEYKKYVDKNDPDSSASEAFTKATEVYIEPYLSVFITF